MRDSNNRRISNLEWFITLPVTIFLGRMSDCTKQIDGCYRKYGNNSAAIVTVLAGIPCYFIRGRAVKDGPGGVKQYRRPKQE